MTRCYRGRETFEREIKVDRFLDASTGWQPVEAFSLLIVAVGLRLCHDKTVEHRL